MIQGKHKLNSTTKQIEQVKRKGKLSQSLPDRAVKGSTSSLRGVGHIKVIKDRAQEGKMVSLPNSERPIRLPEDKRSNRLETASTVADKAETTRLDNLSDFWKITIEHLVAHVVRVVNTFHFAE